MRAGAAGPAPRPHRRKRRHRPDRQINPRRQDHQRLRQRNKPRNRYRADSTIKWLKQIKPDSARTIVGITNEDVSVNKGAHKDYGVMGLGYKPGKACVVSTFRLRKTASSRKHFQQRLFKVVVHEMGHNFGLDHCPDETCIMVDAEGQMKLDQEKDLCSSCKQKLQIK